MTTKKPVVITTEHRGVFFGYVVDDSKAPERIELESARMCVYWDRATRGVLGLASGGPTSGCKITRPIPKITAWKITAVLDCTPEAAEKWEASPWS